MLLILITCSASAFADDGIDNSTLTTSDDAIDEVPLEESDVSQVIASEDGSSNVVASDEGIDDVPLKDDSSSVIITEDNYDDYFNKYTGKLRDGVDANINTIKIANVSNKAFTIDRPLNLMPASDDCQIKNGVIHLIEGSSGSNITNLVINNTKGEIYQDGLFVSKLHGIWFSNSSDNLIFNNTIRIAGVEGCYAMPMGYSSRNRILYNDIVTTFTSCILMGLCDYNNISYNRIEILTLHSHSGPVSNPIYFNPFGHADYSGPADCIGTYISNNYIKNSCNDVMAFTVNILGESNDTSIINNTIINGYMGIKVYDEWPESIQAKNVLIENNTVINATTSIWTSNRDTIVSNNRIMGSSMDVGIDISGGSHKERNSSVFNNEITYENLYCAITLSSQANVFNNTIRLARYGQGIGIGGDNSIVKDNYIHTTGDNGVGIGAHNIIFSDNIIHTKANGVSIQSTVQKYKWENNTIYNNKIYADKYAVFIQGYVYNTRIYDNYIETNETEAFYINVYTTLTDNNLGNISDNTVNGVIENTETLIINDTNFYDYFDENGYFLYNFKDNSHKIIFLTFLSNKNLYFTDEITLTSNKQANLLYNVTITLMEDACDSIIKDFKFYNFNKQSIVLDGVENIAVFGNEFTVLTDDIYEEKVISAVGGCSHINITDNNIYINSKADYTYAISVSEPATAVYKYLSDNFIISNNNILIKSTGVSEGIYLDSLTDSSITCNNINIISDGSAYGITICDILTNPHNFTIDSNKIIVNSKEMSYLIELYRVEDCQITNNYIKGTSNGVYGIGLYTSSSTIRGNKIVVLGKPLTDNQPADALGKGNSAVYITRLSQIGEFENNTFDVDGCEVLINHNSNIEKTNSNAFVIGNHNYDFYFDSNGKLIPGIIKDNDLILFKNFTDAKTMDINVSVTIMPYTHFNTFSGNLILSEGCDKTVISGFDFKNGTLVLNHVSDIEITENNFTCFTIKDNTGFNNSISNNLFTAEQRIVLNNCLNDTVSFNVFNNTLDSYLILINKSNETSIFNNSFNISGTLFKVIVSDSSSSTHIFDNDLDISGNGEIFAYYAHDALNDKISNNNVLINSTSVNSSAVYYNSACNNEIKFNRIISSSDEGKDYAIVIMGRNNTVSNNYLISSNGFKRGNDAVNALNNSVYDNLPVIIYVSLNGTADGNGTFENPYPTITKAIEKSINGAVIYILPGMYNESNIVVDKNITLTAINLEGNTYINALSSQLFNIKANGILTVNALKIFNGFSVEGGSLFNNHGTLMINNSVICNSSSYYDNSNPTFKYKNKYDKDMYSYDCSKLGIGGAIRNYGELIIDSSTLYDNYAHKGGAIADFGKTTIVNSLFFNNTGVHGGAIYTNSSEEFTIENSEFRDNLAIQTLDHCPIKRIEYEKYPNMSGLRYRYLSVCGSLPGMGGAIFSNTVLNIDNSLFNNNVAKYGGAIGYDSSILDGVYYRSDDLNYYTLGPKIKYSLTSILNIRNSRFTNNEAKNTSAGNLSMLVDDIYGGNLYNIHATGGAIFGAIREFNVYNSTFENNLAESNGGALCVQSLNSTIEASKFLENTAGERGGALDLFGNVEIFNTEIINNSAKYGGALQYKSYTFYERVQNEMVMFNVTVAGNKALTYGGAFNLGTANFAIRNSNIYDNFAPEYATLAGGSNVDMRGNWWGSINGPDDSIYYPRVKFRTWLGQKVDWGSALVSNTKNTKENNENKGNGGKSSNSNSVSTGSGVHTGSTLSIDTSHSSSGGRATGFEFDGNWPSGNNNGNGGRFGYSNGINSSNSNGKGKASSQGNVNSNGEGRTDVKGNVVNSNSLSRTNSSSINNLASVGMTANAADSSMSSQSSPSSDDGNGGSEGVSKAYEITKDVKKEINLNEDLSIFNILFVLLWIFLFIGFYRRYKTMDEN